MEQTDSKVPLRTSRDVDLIIKEDEVKEQTVETSKPNSPDTQAVLGDSVKIIDKQKAQEWKLKGNAAWAKDDLQAALNYYTEAIGFDPNSAELYRNRSAAHVALKLYDKAMQDADKAIELDASCRSYGRKAEVYCYMGIITQDLEALQNSIKNFSTACTLDPQNLDMAQLLETAEYFERWLRIDKASKSSQSQKSS